MPSTDRPISLVCKVAENQGWEVDLELRPGELQALGLVAAQWAYLEHQIKQWSKAFCGIIGCTVPAEVESDSFRKRLRALRSLKDMISMPAEYSDRFLSYLERIGSLSGKRHLLLHGLLQWDEGNLNRLLVYSHKNPHDAPQKTDRRKIEKFAHEVAALNFELVSFPEFEFGSTGWRRKRPPPLHLDPWQLGPGVPRPKRTKRTRPRQPK